MKAGDKDKKTQNPTVPMMDGGTVSSTEMTGIAPGEVLGLDSDLSALWPQIHPIFGAVPTAKDKGAKDKTAAHKEQ